jgi:DNA-binding response OmpR family regulator
MGRGVLIVDDHAAIRDILALKFNAQGFDVPTRPLTARKESPERKNSVRM